MTDELRRLLAEATPDRLHAMTAEMTFEDEERLSRILSALPALLDVAEEAPKLIAHHLGTIGAEDASCVAALRRAIGRLP